MEKRKKYWRRLDNAALIFPAARRKGWFNRFRMSVTLKEDIDKEVLQSALDVTVKRFPLICSRLRRGFFWYYLEELDNAPRVILDGFQPLMVRPFDDVRKSAIRVLYYKNRIAVEFFHAVTDGAGGTVFVKSLLAEYLEQKYDIKVPSEHGVLTRNEVPCSDEFEDSFTANKGDVAFNRKEGQAFHIRGQREPDDFLHLTCATVKASDVLEKARELGVSATAYLSAVLIETLIPIQERQIPKKKKWLPVRVQIPVDLRRLFSSKTLRNFVMVINIGVNPRMGAYDFAEIAGLLSHQLALGATAKNMQAIYTTNVNSALVPIIKIVPLFLKNIIMRAMFDAIGESQATIGLSNLGAIKVPEEMEPFIEYFDFIIGPQAASPHNVAVCSFDNVMRINFVRNSVDPEVERGFYRNLVKHGIHVYIQSNLGLQEKSEE
ncbi:MAG: hypothetical protein J6Y65_00680 [Eggerthellaceae bacterium]|nr:hypothetical protein [Eggerthellaceae bacterium]